MKVAYCSDLHLDVTYNDYYSDVLGLSTKLKSDANVLVLAGDIVEIENLMRSEESSKYDITVAVKKIFTELCSNHEHVIYVFGNHEYYHGHFTNIYTKFKNIVGIPDNLIVLNNSSVVIDDVMFYGGTCWTNFNNNNPIAKMDAELRMNDYRKITTGSYRSFRANDALQSHRDFVSCLEQNIKANSKKVIISHHAPSLRSIPAEYKESNLNPAYASDLEYLFEKYNITHWIHGHIHTEHDYLVGNTNILCRPGGYPSEYKLTMSFKIGEFNV